ncbi:hypothetical protein NUW58_g6409 [Xylaria curta]|uniref:Uncharacterized protein n=1 Tax=Xylaria curta TaxID=42375 RepID=A0ACC1NUG8_9PEZI|nr:hypothetical protein NUW58_g6409 [Xylaria curta]
MSTPADANTGPWDKETKRKFQKYVLSAPRVRLVWTGLILLPSAYSKSTSEYFDPCQEAASKSIRCLNRNGGDRTMCTDYFDPVTNGCRSINTTILSTMTPLRIPPAPRLVQLRHSVDIQLDHAFHEQQWAVAANLARQRHKTTKDEYYKAVEIAAKSRSDNAIDRTAGREIVQTMVSDNTVIKDVDTLDLYEFAVDGLSMDYAKSIGVLRARLAKAVPKDQNAGLKCLEACMWHSDWENAQEIAASLNKNFLGDRKLLFQNILTTFLVATADNTHENKKKLFANLAKAQADRAFNLRPLVSDPDKIESQIQINENEVKLWIHIREKFGSAQENLKLLSLPNWGPLFFLERGFPDAFLRGMHLLTLNEQWEEIVRVANCVFDKVIEFGQEKSVVTKTNDNQDRVPKVVKEKYMNASREWFLWVSTITATRKLPDGGGSLEIFRQKIQKIVRVLTSHHRMDRVLQQNYDQLLLDIAFTRAAIDTRLFDGRSGGNNKIHHLLALVKKHLHESNCFTTLKGFLELLNKDEIADFVLALESEQTKDSGGVDVFGNLLLVALRLRIRFFQATSLTVGEECRLCHSMAHDGPDCVTCLRSITECALGAFHLAMQDKDVSQRAADEAEDPLSTLAVLGSISLIKLAGVGHKSWQSTKESPLYHTDIQLFLQAVVWLDFYLRKTPKNDSLRLLLVKLYLMMGCVTRALQIWGLFDVKNTLLECLGTICLDRLASISPGHFITGPSQLRSFADPFIRHFETAIERRYPDIVIKTLQNNSYAEIPGVVELVQNQSRNCVLVLAVVESRRGMRLKTGRTEMTIEEEPLIGSLSPDYEFRDFTDHNPLPQWAGPQSTPIQELTAYGPLPTNRRCHLSVLAERFLDLVCYVQPKDFKPSKVTQLLLIDWQAAASSCQSLHANLDTLIYGEGYEGYDLTGPEACQARPRDRNPLLLDADGKGKHPSRDHPHPGHYGKPGAGLSRRSQWHSG